MAYYQRWEKDLSGDGNYQNYYWPDSNGDDANISWIFAPFLLLIGGIFKLPIFKNLIGFLIGFPLAIAIGIVILIITILFLFFAEMVYCWRDIIKEVFYDIKKLSKWIRNQMGEKKGLSYYK